MFNQASILTNFLKKVFLPDYIYAYIQGPAEIMPT